MTQHHGARLDQRGLARAGLVHGRVAGAAGARAGRERVARDLGALAGQRRREDLVAVAAAPPRRRSSRADDGHGAGLVEAQSWRQRRSSPAAMRAATCRVGLVSPRSTWESIGAETPERSARSRSERPSASRSALTRDPPTVRVRGDRHPAAYAITYACIGLAWDGEHGALAQVQSMRRHGPGVLRGSDRPLAYEPTTIMRASSSSASRISRSTGRSASMCTSARLGGVTSAAASARRVADLLDHSPVSRASSPTCEGGGTARCAGLAEPCGELDRDGERGGAFRVVEAEDGPAAIRTSRRLSPRAVALAARKSRGSASNGAA